MTSVGHSGKPSSNRGRLLAERCMAVTCLVIACWVGLRAESLVTTSSVSRPGAFPAHGALWIAALVLGLASLAWTVQSFRRGRPAPAEQTGPLRDALGAFVIMLIGAWLVTWLGLLLACGIAYIGLMVFYRDRNWLLIGVTTVAYLCAVYYGLGVALRVPLPTSPILDLPF